MNSERPIACALVLCNGIDCWACLSLRAGFDVVVFDGQSCRGDTTLLKVGDELVGSDPKPLYGSGC